MNLREFREMVRQELGANLENATPENIRSFLDGMQALVYPPKRVGEYIVLDEEGPLDYERLVLDFFSGSLEGDPEKAAIALWLFAMEIWTYCMEQDTAQQFASLLEDWMSEEEG